MSARKSAHKLHLQITRALRGARCLSLDVFDTALLRRTLYPRDLYGFIEEELVRGHGPELRGLANARLEAERRADLAARAEGRGSPEHFHRIYRELGEIHPATGPHLEALLRRELKMESALLVRNDWCHRLFREAVAMGKEVMFLSDMYLPASEIAGWLRREGYDGFAALYVSAEVGKSKHDGGLFEHALGERGLEPLDVVHVGDAFDADFSVPSSLGIPSFWSRAAREHVLTNGRFCHLKEFHLDERSLGSGDRLTLGLLAKEEIRHTEAGEESPEAVGQRLGYQVLGPVQASFVAWINQRADELGLEDLFFVARDGWITKRVFDLFVERGAARARSHYLHASRVSLFISRLARMTTEEAVRDIFDELDFFGMHLSLGRHLVRLGLDPIRFESEVRSTPLGSLERMIDTPDSRAEYLRLIERIDPDIRAMVEEHRVSYDRYLLDLGVWRARRVGVVDNTTSGRTFLRLREVFSRAGSANEVFHGLFTYVPVEGIRRLVPGDDVEGWLYNFTDPGISRVDLDFRAVYEETLLSGPENSFVRAETRQGEVKLVFRPGPDAENYERFTRHVHEGALRFVRDFLEAATAVGVEAPSRSFVYAGLKRFCYAPTSEEGRFFQGRQSGDWTFSKSDWVDLVPARSRLFDFDPLSIRHGIRTAGWREGYLATLPLAVRTAYQTYLSTKDSLSPIRVRFAGAMKGPRKTLGPD